MGTSNFVMVKLARDGQISNVPCYGMGPERDTALVVDRSMTPPAFRLWPLCEKHNIVYLPGERCPECVE